MMIKNLFYKKVMRKQIGDLMGDLGAVNLHGGAGALVSGVDMDGDNAIDSGELEIMLRKTKLSEHFTVKAARPPPACARRETRESVVAPQIKKTL